MTTCVQYPPNLACGDKTVWDAYSADLRERSIDLAWATLRHLTGGLVGNCAVGARPCYRGCMDKQTGSWSGSAWAPPWTPMLRGGFWYNVPCGCGSVCSCSARCEVVLPGYVAEVTRVWIDGAELDRDAYRLDNGRILVRQDGDCWPECQDMNVAWDEPGAFTVEYVPGIKPGPAGEWAAGVLAYEYAKACSGEKCRLPSSVTSIARQGVSMEFSQGMFAGGMTGIREVDAFVLSVNPNHLVKPPLVWSPDLPPTRFTELTVKPPSGPFNRDFALVFQVETTP
jgi:hypothetical protein